MSYPFANTGSYTGLYTSDPTIYGNNGIYESPYLMNNGNYSATIYNPYLGYSVNSTNPTIPSNPNSYGVINFSPYRGITFNALYNHFGYSDPAIINNKCVSKVTRSGIQNINYPKALRGNVRHFGRFR